MSLITNHPTPVLNTANFSFCFGGKDGQSLPLDNQGLMRNLETILLPGTSLTPKETKETPYTHICRVEIPKYPGENLFIDKRFLEITSFTVQTNELTTVEKICTALKNLVGAPYLWGGNWPMGIDEMREFYPPSIDFAQLPEKIQNTWQLKGLDCSGLLYYATKGHTPRNTSDLVTYADRLEIEGLEGNEIVQKVKPLDLLAWKGHVIIVIDNQTCIESTPKEGVHTNNLLERIEKLLKTRKPVNEYSSSFPSFVVRRWIWDFKLCIMSSAK
ncbi:MAG: peptidoglycan endopeptidase [Candidatus Rhabdochlamydia sp.]